MNDRLNPHNSSTLPHGGSVRLSETNRINEAQVEDHERLLNTQALLAVVTVIAVVHAVADIFY